MNMIRAGVLLSVVGSSLGAIDFTIRARIGGTGGEASQWSSDSTVTTKVCISSLSLSICLSLALRFIYSYMYIYIYICVCVWVDM